MDKVTLPESRHLSKFELARPWAGESTASLCRLPIAKAGTFVSSTVTATGASCRAWRSSTATRPWFEFTRRAGGPKTLEDRNIFEMMIRRSFGEITLELTAEQFARLNR